MPPPGSSAPTEPAREHGSARDHFAWVERIAQPVADVVDGEHSQEDRGTREEGPVRREVQVVLASKRMRPHVGMSGGKPRPRNESEDSAMIAAATSREPATITGPTAFGRMWRTTCRSGAAPRLRAASTNSL